MFPIVLSGISMGKGNRPPGAAPKQWICDCPNKSPLPGLPFAMWEPARLIEIVRKPYCSPVLDTTLQITQSRRLGGHNGRSAKRDTSDGVFYHYHYYAFPIAVILQLFTGCTADGFMDMDMMYMSELDPFWNDDEMAFFLNPEVALVANPIAQAACADDAVAAVAGHPSSKLFWCAGSWGGLYPLSGHIAHNASAPREVSLATNRAISAMHRRLLARKTMGKDAMCGAKIFPTVPKTQYKLQQLFPLAEANGNHWLGESTFMWGEFRSIPGAGEDFVELVWRWKDCCIALF